MFLQWVRGRQEGSYYKMALIPSFLSHLFNCDAYLLKFPVGCSVMKHKDPVAEGYNHHRMNIIVKRSSHPMDRMYILGPIKRWMRVELFRPDLHEHGLQPIRDSIYMLSFGCRIKQ